jgi:hypothetical protein
MDIYQIINHLTSKDIKGLQLSKKSGILNSTWLIYKKNEFYFYFDINQKIEFIDRYKYAEKEIIEEFKNSYFTIDEFID